MTAGRILRQRFAQSRDIRFKGQRDIVTDADLAANRAIRSILERATPEYAIVSEEDIAPELVTREPRRGASQIHWRDEFVWIIDPLDGTTNYARRYPVYSVSIGLARRGRVELGVVYDPVREECFSAQRGRGAFLNRTRLQASRVARLEDAVVGFEMPRDQKLRERGLDWFAQLAARSQTARIGGSAALSLCYIGAARLDVYLQLSLSAWDVAAGMLVAREAGGRVTHLDGRAATLRGGAYLAGSRKIFRALLETIRQLDAR
jgi:myo-inositol-1(or 4)-monophosphatase